MKMNKNRNGFTLVELLVTIAILGIITGISIPVIRNVQTAQAEKKYTVYLDSVNYAAKAYTDSYSIDLFNDRATGCAYVYYNDLNRYHLIQDIDISGITCNSDYTVVKVVKYRDKYYFNPYIGCGEGNGSKIENPNLFRPTKAEISEICDINSNAVITFISTPKTSDAITYKIFSPKINIYSETGVTDSPPRIQYGFSYSDDPNNLSIINNSWKDASFKILPVTAQEKFIKAAKPQLFSSNNSFETPSNATGDVYLVLKVNKLVDLAGEEWKTIKKPSDNYVILGPYRVDNEAPNYNGSKIVSSGGSRYNSTKPKFDLKVTDEHFTPEKDLKICYTYDSDDSCPKPNNSQELAGMTKFKKYKKDEVLTKITDNYDGAIHKVHVTVADAAGNYQQKTFDYRVSKAYKLTFNTDGGSTCNPASISQIENYAWNESVVNESGLNVHTFCTPTKAGNTFGGWYTGKNGTGTEVKVTDKATKDLTVYAKWIPKTVKVTFDCNGGATSGTKTYTYGTSGQKFNHTCTKLGYTLDGWKLNKADTVKKYDVANSISDSWINSYSPSTTLYAHWTLASYTCAAGKYLAKSATACVTCTANHYCPGGTFKYSTTVNQGINNCSSGYSCGTGKSKASDCCMSVPANKFIKKEFDATPTACETGYEKAAHTVCYGNKSACSAKSYTISYNLNGGSVSGNKTSYTIETATFTLKNPSKTEYKFTGWTGSNGNTASTSVSIKKGSTGNKSYTANWYKYCSKTWNPTKDESVANCSSVGGKTNIKLWHWTNAHKTSTANIDFTLTVYACNCTMDNNDHGYGCSASVTNITKCHHTYTTSYITYTSGANRNSAFNGKTPINSNVKIICNNNASASGFGYHGYKFYKGSVKDGWTNWNGKKDIYTYGGKTTIDGSLGATAACKKACELKY